MYSGLPQARLEDLAGPSTWRQETAPSGALGRWWVLCPQVSPTWSS